MSKVIYCKEYDDNEENNELECSINQDDKSDTDTVNTQDILDIDPLYFRLNKFLSCDDGKSVAQILNEILLNLQKLNSSLESYNVSKSTEG